MNIVEAIKHDRIFKSYLGDSLATWQPWLTAMRALYGLPITKARSTKLVKQCTGLDAPALPKHGFDAALFLTGRRSGKSRVAAVVGAYEAVLGGRQKSLSKGEVGVVPIISPSKSQSRIVHGYIRSLFEVPALANLVVNDTKTGLELADGTRIEVLTGDWRHIRGFTLLACIVDEACFFGLEDEGKVKSDTELVRALQPALATASGKLIAISSPYARRGWCYTTCERDWGNANANTLVWRAPSRVMNPTLPQHIVDRALQEDLAAARAEYLAEWRDDVAAYLPRAVVEELVVKGRKELMPVPGRRYVAFADLSGGRGDDATLAIAHKQDRTVVIDKVERHRPPFNPHMVVTLMSETLELYGLGSVTGDNYGAEFVASAFGKHGVRYHKAKLNASQLYTELLPRLCSGEVELLDDDATVGQISNLERHTRSGGKDLITHPRNQHDDLANVVAGVCYLAGKDQITVGAFGRPTTFSDKLLSTGI